MNNHGLRRWFGILAVAVALCSRVAAQSGYELYQQALSKERAEGQLKEAIALYQRVVAAPGVDHALAAKAWLQIGRCYEKLGKADARNAYEHLIAAYPDQTDLVAEARARVAALARTEAASRPVAPVVTALPRVDQFNEVQALSPDGSKALFISFEKGQNIAVYDFAARQAKLLTEFDWTSSYVYFGAWSPDGRRVAYTQSGFGSGAVAEIRVATLDGDSRAIFRNEANPGREVVPAAWLPDGRSIVAALERSDGTSAIGLIPVAGGPFTALRSQSWSGQVSRPRVSPDGRFVAFADGAVGMRDIHVLGVDGRVAYRITDQPGDDIQPLWSPDGQYLVFVSARLGRLALWAVPMKDGRAVGEPVRVRDGMEGIDLIDWTARGLVYADRVQTRDIYTVAVDRSSGQPTGVPRQLPYSRTGQNSGPVWSPDGRSIAFASGSRSEADRRYIVVMPEGGGDSREYLIPTTRYSNPQDPYDLRWFGDGSGLGFSGTDGRGQPSVFQLSLATGRWKTYPSPAKTWTRLEWNADGTKYFYARQGVGSPTAAIVERDVATGSEREIYAARGKMVVFRGLRLSPDRRSLAVTVSVADEGAPRISLVVIDTETGRGTTLLEETCCTTLDTNVSLGVPAWSADGRSLLVPRTAGRNAWPDLRVVPIGGGSIRSFALDKTFAGGASKAAGELAPSIRDVMWSPDGTRMTFVLASFRSDTWLIENVLAGVGAATTVSRP